MASYRKCFQRWNYFDGDLTEIPELRIDLLDYVGASSAYKSSTAFRLDWIPLLDSLSDSKALSDSIRVLSVKLFTAV